MAMLPILAALNQVSLADLVARACGDPHMATLSSLQPTFIYHVENLDSNDTLYSGDPAYQNDIERFTNQVMEELVNQLGEIGKNKESDMLAKRRQT
ncbi:vps35l, partial [Symbiodinium sp. KB8]